MKVETTLERLRLVRDAVRRAEPEAFNMFNWDCGTTACAIGHTCRDPRAAASGLHMEEQQPIYTDPSGRRSIGFDAISLWLGFPPSGAFFDYWLFTWCSPNTRKVITSRYVDEKWDPTPAEQAALGVSYAWGLAEKNAVLERLGHAIRAYERVLETVLV